MIVLKDVAEASGVSIRTVGRALRSNGYVGEHTRQRVLAVARSMGYRPHRAARSLRTGKSYIVNVFMHSIDELQTVKLAALQRELARSGYSVNVIFASPQVQARENLFNDKPAGVIVFPHSITDYAKVQQYLTENNLPSVFIDPVGTASPAIYIDRQQGVGEAVRYLAGRGYQRIAYAGPTDGFRLQGYRRALAKLGREEIWLAVNPGPGNNHYEAGKKVFARWREMDPRPDAIQAYSDAMAIGLLAAALEQKIIVPRDLAVVGFDNRSIAGFSFPLLTTVAQPNAKVGKIAAKMLLEQLRESKQGKISNRSAKTKLILRDSA